MGQVKHGVYDAVDKIDQNLLHRYYGTVGDPPSDAEARSLSSDPNPGSNFDPPSSSDHSDFEANLDDECQGHSTRPDPLVTYVCFLTRKR